MDRLALERREADERRGHVGGLGVVDVGDAVALGDLLQAVGHAAEGPEAVADRVRVQAARQRDRRGGHRVADVVRAAQRELLGAQQRRVVPPQRAGPQRQLGLGRVAGQDAAGAAAEVDHAEVLGRDRDVVVALVAEDLQLGPVVGLDGAVAVEVVALQVEDHRRLGREGDRVLQLERRALADHDRSGIVLFRMEGERRVGGPDVADDRDRHAGLAVQVAEQLGRRRLAVGPGDRDHLVGRAAPGQLQLAEHRDAAPARGLDHRRGLRDAGRLDHAADALQQRDAVDARVQLDLGRQQRVAPSRSAGELSVAITSSPRACSSAAAAWPERARPTTRNGPGGSGGRIVMHAAR